MKTITACQKIVVRLERDLPGIIQEGERKNIIVALNAYVDNTDRVGVKSNPSVVAGLLVAKGFKSVSDMTADDKKSLFSCILGNFIDSSGRPPSNVMGRFCGQFLTTGDVV
jgi:hypothetical protein